MGSTQTILQIGDLHFPDFRSEKTAVDNHDRQVPGALDSQLELPIQTAIKRSLLGQIRSHPDALIALCGDTTTKGDEQGFVEGLEYLGKILSSPLIDPPLSTDRVHLVPGNHDVAFKSHAPFRTFEDLKRFEDLAKLVDTSLVPTVLTTSHRSTRVTNSSGGSLSVISVNTCRGAGASRTAALERGRAAGYVDDGSQTAAMASSSTVTSGAEEVLDIPLLHPAELTAMADLWAAPEPNSLAVILAHHGLLPQHTPRLNPYTEMVNGGQARRALANVHRPILYLHGHIHEHVVEVVDSPKSGDQVSAHDRTVVIAAPELREGFNKILVHFTDRGRPSGISVEQYRIRHGEQLVYREPNVTHISLTSGSSMQKGRRPILAFLADRRAASGSEMIEYGALQDPTMTPEEVQDVVESLVWSGTLQRTSGNEQTFEESGYLL